MKTYFAFFLILFNLHIHAQSVFNTELIRKIEYSDPLERINVLVLTKPNTEFNFSEFQNTSVHYQAGNIYSITSKIQTIKEIARLKKHCQNRIHPA